MSGYSTIGNLGETDQSKDKVLLWSYEDAPKLSQRLKDVAAYFINKKEGADFNRRKDLNPAELRSFLPNFIVVECLYDVKDGYKEIADASFRLMGSFIADFYGDGTGKRLSNFLGFASLKRFKAIARHAIENRTLTVTKSPAFGRKRSNWDVTMLYVPFASDKDGDVNQFLIFADILKT